MTLEQFLQTENAKTLQDLADAVENGTVELTERQEELVETIFDTIGYRELPYVLLDDEAYIDVIVKNVDENGDIGEANLYFSTSDQEGLDWGTFRDVLSSDNDVDDLINDFLGIVDRPVVRADLNNEQKEIVNESEELAEVYIKDTERGVVSKEMLQLNILKHGDDYYLYAIGKAPDEEGPDEELYEEELLTKIDAKTALKYMKKIKEIDEDDDLYGKDYKMAMINLSKEMLKEFPALYNLDIYLKDDAFIHYDYYIKNGEYEEYTYYPKTVEYEYDADELRELEKQVKKELKQEQKTQPKKHKKEKSVSGPGF